MQITRVPPANMSYCRSYTVANRSALKGLVLLLDHKVGIDELLLSEVWDVGCIMCNVQHTKHIHTF